MTRRALSVAATACIVFAMTAGVAHAGEVTGNGRSLKVENSKWGTGLHARSSCAFSGQEDAQYFEEDGTPKHHITRGDPGHAQSWGRIPKSVRDQLATQGLHPGTACNPTSGFSEG